MINVATPFCGLLRFDELTYAAGVTAVFTVGYRLEDLPDEPWTARFTAFKFNCEPALAQGATALMAAAAQSMVDGLALERNRTVFVSAMRSDETRAAEDGILATLARRSAAAAGCRYLPGALSKSPHLPTGRGRLDPEFRVLLVEGADYRSTPVDADQIIVVDDLIATGKTLELAALAIRDANPGVAVYGFALAKTGWQSLMRLWYGQEVSNDHIPACWEKLWNQPQL